MHWILFFAWWTSRAPRASRTLIGRPPATDALVTRSGAASVVTSLATAAATCRRAVGTAGTHLVQLPLLFGSENLAELFAHVRVEVIELLALLVGQAQAFPRERGKD
jgi:hypothetical protein